jgi:predicted secreted hydrolase
MLAVAAGLCGGCDRQAAAPAAPPALALGDVLSGDPQGFARALEPRTFVFPADHGPHPEYRSEWWYFTGNLRGRDGRRFGFQLTFFRFALTPRPEPRRSAWATSQAYMAHLAVTDAAGGRFHHFERFARGALDLAGARAEPVRVWLEDWQAEGLPGDGWRLRAAEQGVALDLELIPERPVVLQGEAGLSRKSAAPGNASYYYSQTRLAARGGIRLEGVDHAVQGAAWLDREWGTSALAADQAGWDWFALQLADGRDLMFYRLRRHDGTSDPHSAGSLVQPDGTVRRLGAGDLRITETGRWASPADGALYPALWRLEVPAAALDLRLRPLLADQELRASVRYWEGAVEVLAGGSAATPAGHGYVELTGYAGPASRSHPAAR